MARGEILLYQEALGKHAKSIGCWRQTNGVGAIGTNPGLDSLSYTIATPSLGLHRPGEFKLELAEIDKVDIVIAVTVGTFTALCDGTAAGTGETEL